MTSDRRCEKQSTQVAVVGPDCRCARVLQTERNLKLNLASQPSFLHQHPHNIPTNTTITMQMFKLFIYAVVGICLAVATGPMVVPAPGSIATGHGGGGSGGGGKKPPFPGGRGGLIARQHYAQRRTRLDVLYGQRTGLDFLYEERECFVPSSYRPRGLLTCRDSLQPSRPTHQRPRPSSGHTANLTASGQ